MEDLSHRHEPVGTLFPEPGPAESYKISEEQIAQFNEQGFVSGIRLCDDRQVEALREALARVADPGHPRHSLFHEYHSNESTNADTVLFHALGAWRVEEAFHDLLWNPAFLIPASQLLGGSVRFWHDQLFSKPAKHGGVVAWHQDYSYWTRTVPIAHLTCWLALDDSTVENGCLHYVPGSHRWNLLPITGLAGNMEEIMTVLSEEQKAAFRPAPIELKKGECAIHHSLLVHGSYENRSERPRRATVINVFRDGVQSARDDEPLERVPPIPAGQAMGGQFFPLLYDAAR
ncbi:MAG: phytanoyl-CoA dioxygenase family protein [Bryobacterales bacterium]|nr:phytanoyl-CoA dioxygenase family protein [Bryobacterales bacterium]